MLDPAFQQCDISHQGFKFSVSYFIRPGAAGTLLCLHGLGASKGDFLDAVYQDALRDYTLVAFDLPGFGETPYPSDRVWRIEDLVQVTDQLTAALNLNEFVILGHSLGGLASLLFAEKHANKLRGFVDIEGNLDPQDCFVTRAVAQRSFTDFVRTQHLQNLKLRCASAPDPGARNWAEALGRQGTERAFYDYSVSAVECSDRQDLFGIFMGLTIPRLFVYGSANSHLSYLSKLKLSDVSVVEVPDSGHWPHIDNPGYFYRAFAGFLQTL